MPPTNPSPDQQDKIKKKSTSLSQKKNPTAPRESRSCCAVPLLQLCGDAKAFSRGNIVILQMH
jgi:hypothetical protein